MVDTFEEAMRAEHSPQNSSDAFGLSTGCFLSLGGSAAAGSEASDVPGQAAPVLNAECRRGPTSNKMYNLPIIEAEVRS